MSDNSAACIRLIDDDWFIEEILSMSDDEILAECRAHGDDPEVIAAQMRDLFERAVAAAPAHQATHTMDEANELNERQYHALQGVLGPLVNSIYVPMHQRICPTCGAPMQASTPAQPAPDANIANEPTPSGYMSRPKML